MDHKPGKPSAQEVSRPGKAKLPYQKPAFRYERVFETMALACGKINPTQGQCASLLKSS
jgi:hypothetical protein